MDLTICVESSSGRRTADRYRRRRNSYNVHARPNYLTLPDVRFERLRRRVLVALLYDPAAIRTHHQDIYSIVDQHRRGGKVLATHTAV